MTPAKPYRHEDFSNRKWSEDYHCGTHVQAVYRECLGIELPPYSLMDWGLQSRFKALMNYPGRGQFRPIFKPVDFCIVEMGTSDRTWDHVGVYFDGRVSHCGRGSRVIFEPLQHIQQRYIRHRYWLHETSDLPANPV